MKIYFMKKEALDILKSDLEITYSKYYTEKNNKWLWDVCGGDPFVEYKDVPDFDLTSLTSDLSTGEIEFNNCKILYKNLSFLSESQASDERLWAGLCHSVFYDYVRKRWGYDKNSPKTAKEAISNIKSRFFFSGGTRAGLYRNTISKCWWVGNSTFDKTKSNPFEKLDVIGSNDISTKISDIFYSNTFSGNPIILDGLIEGLRYFKQENIQLSMRDHIRPSLQLLNAIGGGIVLDCLSVDDVSEIIIENIIGIIQGDDLGVDLDDDTEDVSLENSEASFNQQSEEYVSLGQRVVVLDHDTNTEKIYSADFLGNDATIPLFIKQLIGQEIGTTFTYQNKEYTILKSYIEQKV